MSSKVEGLIWDLDGVITDTSDLHREAWILALRQAFNLKENLDEELLRRSFDGVPRYAGIKRFLETCGLMKVKGRDDHEIEKLASQISKSKNSIFREIIKNRPISVFNDSIEVLKLTSQKGIPSGLASQSENADLVVDKVRIRKYLKSLATGITAKSSLVKNKPDPDFYRHAASLLGVDIHKSIVFEDTYAGAYSAVSAGALKCIGVARNPAKVNELISAGCDVICRDLNFFSTFLNL